MITPSIQQIKDAYQKKDYTYFTSSKPYNLNIWGIRKQYGEINKFYWKYYLQILMKGLWK